MLISRDLLLATPYPSAPTIQVQRPIFVVVAGYGRDKEVLVIARLVKLGVPGDSCLLNGVGEGGGASRFWMRAWFNE